MGLIDRMLGWILGNGRNAVVEVSEVFRENAEASAVRAASAQANALSQFTAEFQTQQRGAFDRFMDGLNRLPRPALALGTLGLFVAAMTDPVWFTQRMIGLQSVPEPLWWLLGAIVSFYFGARNQLKGQEFQKSLAQTLARTQTQLAERSDDKREVKVESEPVIHDIASDNAAVDDWKRWSTHRR